jgi:hypothetical protein
LTGTASFGFTAAYLPLLASPVGQLAFTLPAANLSLASNNSYDWLVVTQYATFLHGTGKVNNAGSFGYFVAVTDPDAPSSNGIVDIRVKIWDASKGEATGVVYDTQAGALYTAFPSTALGGGLVLHGNAKRLKASGTGSINSPAGAYAEALFTTSQPMVLASLVRGGAHENGLWQGLETAVDDALVAQLATERVW